MHKTDTDLCHCRIVHEERIIGARHTALHPDEVEQLVQMFKAMADPTRINILRALEHSEMCVCDLAAYLGLTASAASHQLRLLRQLRLVAGRRQGKVLYYRLTDHHVSQLARVALEHIRE